MSEESDESRGTATVGKRDEQELLSLTEVDANLPHWLDADLEDEILTADRQVGQTREVRVNGPETFDLVHVVWRQCWRNCDF